MFMSNNIGLTTLLNFYDPNNDQPILANNPANIINNKRVYDIPQNKKIYNNITNKIIKRTRNNIKLHFVIGVFYRIKHYRINQMVLSNIVMDVIISIYNTIKLCNKPK